MLGWGGWIVSNMLLVVRWEGVGGVARERGNTCY